MAKNMSTEGRAVRREPADTRFQAVVHCSFSADIGERYGFVNRSIPDAELDAFVDSLAERMGRFETRALATGKKMVNARAGVPSEGDLWTSNRQLMAGSRQRGRQIARRIADIEQYPTKLSVFKLDDCLDWPVMAGSRQ